jgi:hypothetical protein
LKSGSYSDHNPECCDAVEGSDQAEELTEDEEAAEVELNESGGDDLQ